MFRAVTNDPKLLRDSIDTISQIIDDGLFKINNSGLELLASDRAMVSVVDFKLKSSGFEEFECDKEASIGINLLNLLTVLKRAEGGDKLILNLNEVENKFEIILEGRSKRKFAI
ncbi:MAG: proliferating cell nuclear antigen (pcna), partial [Candidatus Hodarchaeales archaeon]